MSLARTARNIVLPTLVFVIACGGDLGLQQELEVVGSAPDGITMLSEEVGNSVTPTNYFYPPEGGPPVPGAPAQNGYRGAYPGAAMGVGGGYAGANGLCLAGQRYKGVGYNIVTLDSLQGRAQVETAYHVCTCSDDRGCASSVGDKKCILDAHNDAVCAPGERDIHAALQAGRFISGNRAAAAPPRGAFPPQGAPGNLNSPRGGVCRNGGHFTGVARVDVIVSDGRLDYVVRPRWEVCTCAGPQHCRNSVAQKCAPDGHGNDVCLPTRAEVDDAIAAGEYRALGPSNRERLPQTGYNNDRNTLPPQNGGAANHPSSSAAEIAPDFTDFGALNGAGPSSSASTRPTIDRGGSVSCNGNSCSIVPGV